MMTDGERQELVAALRRTGLTGLERVPICAEAADEIERLSEEVKRLGKQRDEAVDVCTRMGERLAEARGYEWDVDD